MSCKLHFLAQSWQYFSRARVFPYITLLIWILPILIFNSQQNSLMAHDEGLYAWRSRLMLESGDWIHPWSVPHHKTPGYYWLIASSYTVFGMNEFSVRLPSMIFGICSIILIYEIGKIILNQKVAWLAAAILSVEFLWLQYCRLGTPDVPMIFLVLLAIFGLLKAELNSSDRYIYGLIVGLSFGLGFLIRSFVIFVPMIALFPYLIWEHRRHHHLFNPMLYLGFIIGLIPTFIWIWLSSLYYGDNSYVELFNFLFRLGVNERQGNGILFYIWNIPIKAFPWFFFSIFGIVFLLRHPLPRYQLIIIGLPLTLFTQLSLFSTRISHYSLSLYPFIALLAAVGLDWLTTGWDDGHNQDKLKKTSADLFNLEKLRRNLSYIFGILGLLLVIVSIVAILVTQENIRQYATVTLVLGIGWLILPLIWICRYCFVYKFVNSKYWLAGWLTPVWLALAVAGSNGFFSNYNPEIKTFLEQPAIAQILNTYPVNFIDVGGKTGVILNFYTSQHGQKFSEVPPLPIHSYTWIKAEKVSKLSQPYQILGSVKNYQLIKILPDTQR